MVKQLLFSLTCLALLAATSQALAVETWDVEFDGTGSPGDQGWSWSGSTSHFNDDYKIGVGDQVGWFTTVGNPGSFVGRSKLGDNWSKATGWTVEFRMLALDYTETVASVGAIGDTTAYPNWGFESHNDGIDTMHLASGSNTASVSLDLSVEHTFRLVRQANSPTVELYLDDDFSSPAATLTLFEPVGHDNDDNTFFAVSDFEASYDYFRIHHGATVPEPASLALMGLGGLMMLRWRNH